MIRLTDVSSFQRADQVHWSQLRSSGYIAAYVKATDAVRDAAGNWVPIIDKLHETHTQNARGAGVITGSYAFGHPTQDVTASANFFVQHACFDQMRPVIDMEALAAGDVVPSNAGEWCLAWCKIVEAATGVKPIVYASTSYAAAMGQQLAAIGKAAELAAYDLWDAQYSQNRPKAPPPWDTIGWVAWQDQGDVKIPGIDTLADTDQAPALEPLLVPTMMAA